VTISAMTWPGITRVAVEVVGAQDGVEQRITEAPCLVCVTALYEDPPISADRGQPSR
jgi:hypothetical protein